MFYTSDHVLKLTGEATQQINDLLDATGELSARRHWKKVLTSITGGTTPTLRLWSFPRMTTRTNKPVNGLISTLGRLELKCFSRLTYIERS